MDEFRLAMKDLEEFRVLRTIDSNNMVIIVRQRRIIDNKDIQLNILKTKAKRDKWLIGGTLGGALIIGILTAFLIK